MWIWEPEGGRAGDLVEDQVGYGDQDVQVVAWTLSTREEGMNARCTFRGRDGLRMDERRKTAKAE